MDGTTVETLTIEKLVEKAEKATPKKPVILANGLTQNEELFCQAMVKHGDAQRAVAEGGYMVKSPGAARVKAWKIQQREKIHKRIQELRQVTSLRNDITVDLVIGMIREVYVKAMEAGQFANANNAAKMLGEYVKIFEQKAPSVMNVLNISDPIAMDKEIRRLAAAAEVPLGLLAPPVQEAEFEEVSDSGNQGDAPSGRGDSDEHPSGDLYEGVVSAGV